MLVFSFLQFDLYWTLLGQNANLWAVASEYEYVVQKRYLVLLTSKEDGQVANTKTALLFLFLLVDLLIIDMDQPAEKNIHRC